MSQDDGNHRRKQETQEVFWSISKLVDKIDRMTRYEMFAASMASAAVVISIFGDWIKARFQLSGRARLKLVIDKDEAGSLAHWGWIEDAILISDPKTWAEPCEDDRGRLKLHFFRVKVTNDSQIPARSVSVWVKKFKCRDAHAKEEAIENVQPLRWSDFWRLRTDRERNAVLASDTDIEFKMLPEHSSKYCDLCFFYEPSGPPQIGGFRRNWVYLAVRNLPSSTYAIEGNKKYLVELHATAENAKSVDVTVEIDVNWSIEDRVSIRSARKH